MDEQIDTSSNITEDKDDVITTDDEVSVFSIKGGSKGQVDLLDDIANRSELESISETKIRKVSFGNTHDATILYEDEVNYDINLPEKEEYFGEESKAQTDLLDDVIHQSELEIISQIKVKTVTFDDISSYEDSALNQDYINVATKEEPVNDEFTESDIFGSMEIRGFQNAKGSLEMFKEMLGDDYIDESKRRYSMHTFYKGANKLIDLNVDKYSGDFVDINEFKKPLSKNKLVEKSLSEELSTISKSRQSVFTVYQKSSLESIDKLNLENKEFQILDSVHIKDRRKPNVVKKPKLKKKIKVLHKTPFVHKWAFGYNPYVPVLNLTMRNQTVVAYVSSHLVILYNYIKNKMKVLQGHVNPLTFISSDSKGRWIASVDSGENSSLIVWNVKSRMPVFTKFLDKGFKMIKLSPCGRYLVALSHGNDQTLSLYEWAVKEPDYGMIQMDNNFGIVQKISFTPRKSNTIGFCLTSNTNVTFVQYVKGNHGMKGRLDYYSPKLSERLQKQFGIFVDTIFIKSEVEAVTGTTEGYILLWKSGPNADCYGMCKKTLANYFFVNPFPITVLTQTTGWIVMGDKGSIVTFLDFNLNILFSKNIKLGPIASIDFNKRPRQYMEPGPNGKRRSKDWEYVSKLPRTAYFKDFYARDCIVGTTEANLFYVNPLNNEVHQLLDQLDGCISAMDANESLNWLCLGTTVPELCLYDIKKKKEKRRLKLHTLRNRSEQISYKATPICCVKFSGNGKYLCCGQTDGSVWLLNPSKLTSYDCITEVNLPIHLVDFSSDNRFLAFVDTMVCIWVYEISESSKMTLVGKCRKAHSISIVALMFIKNEDDSSGGAVLISVGKDKRLVRYEIKRNRKELVMKKELDIRIEEFATPFAATFHPSIHNAIVLSNSQYKYRVLDLNRNVYIKTAQAPSFNECEPVIGLQKLINDNYLFYLTGKYAGIEKLPLDGNPYKTLPMIVSGTQLRFTAFSHKGNYLLTNGERDNCVQIWKVNLKIVDIFESIGGPGLQPYFNLIEGGEHGFMMKEMKDFFIYSQILHYGDLVEVGSKVKDRIKGCEVINLMRALGYFPSQYEIGNVFNELGLKNSEDLKAINFITFVKLFLNHKPAIGVSKYILKKSFETLSSHHGFSLRSHDLINYLMKTGECWEKEELFKVLWSLSSQIQNNDSTELTDIDFINDFLPQEITFSYFYNELLGLVDRTDEFIEKSSASIPHKKIKISNQHHRSVTFKTKSRNY